MVAPQATPATAHALRVAVAAVVCLLLVEWWHLEHANLAVWTTHMVLAQYTFTAFQKGLERVLGRGLGIVVGLALVEVLGNAPFVVHALKILALLAFFYVHFSGRMAYTFLNAGLYLAMIVEVGRHDPNTAPAEGRELFLAILLGVVVATLVVWLSGSEGTLEIQPGGEPLLPFRRDWFGHSLLLVATVEVTQFATRWLNLPTSTALVSVMLLTITPDVQALLRKGKLRLLGAAMGAAWAIGAFVILSRAPHLAVLAILLFGGMFVAAYLARVGGANAYAGVQMGLVLPLVLVVPPDEFGTLTGVRQRLEGIIVALVASLVLGSLWAAFQPRTQAPSHPDDSRARSSPKQPFG